MKKQQIQNQSNLDYNRLQKQIDNCKTGFEAEDVHQFRVAYKKLRAFLRMFYEGAKTGKPIKFSKRLKELYEVAGTIRNLQLQLQRIADAKKQFPKKLNAYEHLLERDLKKLQPKFLKQARMHPAAASKELTDKLLPVYFSTRGYRIFLQQKMATVHSILSAAKFSDSDIHSLRKILKDIFYTASINNFKQELIVFPRILKNKNYAYLKALLIKLGNFQDLCIAAELINPKLIKKLKRSNRELLIQIKKTWLEEKKVHKKNIIQELQKLIAPKTKGAKKREAKSFG